MSKNKVIEVTGLKASFGIQQVLKGITFDVFESEITVILGGSGAGKSVLLKHLLGLYPVQEGMVKIFGKNISEFEEEELNALYKRLGVFYQNGGLLNSLSVAENVALPLQQHSNLSDELIAHIVQSKLNLVHLSEGYSKYPSQLSGGMLKRAALARAIAMDPELLFCDEPGAGLDPVSLARLDALILNLRDQLSTSIIVVTHEIASIMRIADRIVFLSEGKVVFHGTLQQALNTNIKEVNYFFETGKAYSNKQIINK